MDSSEVDPQPELKEAPSLPSEQGQLETDHKPLSKRQQKLLKRREQWLSHKAEKRVIRKEKHKEKHREKVESGIDFGPTRKMLKRNTMKDSSCRISVVIDLSFDDLMSEKDIMKLSQQIQYCYSRNRRAAQPLQFYLTSLGAKTQERLDRIGDYHGWDMNIRHESYDVVFKRDSIIYLSSDSPNVLETLDSSKVYIVGGLVDHNHHKGLCFDRAVKNGINHARLPIDTYLQMNTRKVLAINHVFEILLRFTESERWEEAFFHVIPKRKQAATKAQAPCTSGGGFAISEISQLTNDSLPRNGMKDSGTNQTGECSLHKTVTGILEDDVKVADIDMYSNGVANSNKLLELTSTDDLLESTDFV